MQGCQAGNVPSYMGIGTYRRVTVRWGMTMSGTLPGDLPKDDLLLGKR